MASVDQGKSQNRGGNETSFDHRANFSGAERGATKVLDPAQQPANFSTGLGASSSRRAALAFGSQDTNKGAASDRSDTFTSQGKRDGVIQTYILRRFLGWNGSTPVRWTSAINEPPQPGLTNITIEDEFLVRVPVGGGKVL